MRQKFRGSIRGADLLFSGKLSDQMLPFVFARFLVSPRFSPHMPSAVANVQLSEKAVVCVWSLISLVSRTDVSEFIFMLDNLQKCGDPYFLQPVTPKDDRAPYHHTPSSPVYHSAAVFVFTYGQDRLAFGL